jgi:hypothetical protein
MRRFYEQTLCILQKFLLTNPDLHHGLLGRAKGSRLQDRQGITS